MIKSNLNFDTNILIIDGENRSVAVIRCPAYSDITDKVKLAISEDLCLDEDETIDIEDDYEISYDDLQISVKYKPIGMEYYKMYFELGKIAIY